MKSLIVAIALLTTPAEAGITQWADSGCSQGVNTHDHKIFTWVRQDGSAVGFNETRCHTYSELKDGTVTARVMLCDNGTTPMMAFEPDGHIIWNHVEMWSPSDSNGICD